MMKRKSILCLLLGCLLLFSACGSAQGAAGQAQNNAQTLSAATITLDDASTAVSGSGASVQGSVVTITKGGSFQIEGTLSDGQIVVDAGDVDVTLILSGADITNSTGPAIYIKQAGSTAVTLAEGGVNTLADAADADSATETGREENAALYSEDDMTINGTGTLVVTGNYAHGILSKDDLVIESGIIQVNAAQNGIRGRDSLTIKGGNFDITAGNDALQSNNADDTAKGWITLEGGTYTLNAAHDAIQAETDIAISGGMYHIVSGGGNDSTGLSSEESYKGIKSGTMIHITGGEFTVDSADDAFHSNGDIMIEGGTFAISTGDDAVHADNDLAILDGEITVLTSYEGLEGMTMTVAGGNIDITASDDGINVAGGTDSNTTGRFGPDMFGGRTVDENTDAAPPTGSAADDTATPAADNAAETMPPAGEERTPGGGMGMRPAVSDSQWLKITGGTITINAAGDAIDINGNGEMTGGTVSVSAAANGPDSGLDYDGTFKISGGTLVATGPSQMAQAPGTESEQPSLMLYLSTTYPANSKITITAASGETLLDIVPPNGFANIVFSSPQLQVGESYTVLIDGEQAAEVTLTDTLTRVSDTGEAVTGNMGMGGGRGGMGGGQRPEGEFPAGGGQRPGGGFPGGAPPTDPADASQPAAA